MLVDIHWVCEYCYRASSEYQLPEGWDLVFQSAVCPRCQDEVEANGGYNEVPGGAFAEGASDPRERKVQIDGVGDLAMPVVTRIATDVIRLCDCGTEGELLWSKHDWSCHYRVAWRAIEKMAFYPDPDEALWHEGQPVVMTTGEFVQLTTDRQDGDGIIYREYSQTPLDDGKRMIVRFDCEMVPYHHLRDRMEERGLETITESARKLMVTVEKQRAAERGELDDDDR